MNFVKKDVDINFIKKWMQFGINPIILAILDRRKLISDSDIINCLNPIFENIISPFLFEEIIKACERVNKAVKDKEKIMIFGDRDVDGATSISILFDYLESINADVSWEVPVKDDPYGLNINNFGGWREKNISLCITVDCGITNIEEIRALTGQNIDTVIIDHHEPHEQLPDAFAIINPKTSVNFSFSNLAACGVTFLFVLGHIIYNSQFFNQKFAVAFKNESNYQIDTYLYLKLIDSKIINEINNTGDFNYDEIFLYHNGILPHENIFKAVKKKIIHLNPISKIYKNKIFDYINLNLSAKLSFYNYIFDKLDNIEKCKKKISASCHARDTCGYYACY